MAQLTRLNKIVLLIGSILLSLSNSFAEANKIYKWVDENGKVHYSDRPVENAETLEINNEVSPEEQKRARQQAQRLIQLQQKRVSVDLENKQDDLLQQQAQEQQKSELNNACKDAREAVRILEYQAPVYETDDKGERRYIEDEERQKELARLKSEIAEHCQS